MSIVLTDDIKLNDVEGSIDLIYGGLGSGKTYAATSDILRWLRRGDVVFATWPIAFDGVDERRSLFAVLLGIFGLKRKYRVFDKSNFHYVPLIDMMDGSFLEKLQDITDCHLYVDEGYAAMLFDSYRKTNVARAERLAIYGTRHFNRHIVIVAQRPNAIHVSSRAMVNRFYRCMQPIPLLYSVFGIRLFIKTEYQEMMDETVDENKPVRTSFYFGARNVYRAYDSKYLRGGKSRVYAPNNQVYDVSYVSRFSLLVEGFRPRGGLKAARGVVSDRSSKLLK